MAKTKQAYRVSKRIKSISKPLKLKSRTEKKKKVKKTKKDVVKFPVVVIKHIPHGFYEKEMKAYFSQFGKVLRVTVPRSVKTGRNKDHAFVEFADEDVAQVAAEAMNNYLMFGKLMKCEVIPPENVGKGLFADQLLTFQSKQRKKQARSMVEHKKYVHHIKKRINDTVNQLAALGINFKFECPELDFDQSTSIKTPAHVIDPDEDEISFKTTEETKTQDEKM